MDLLKHMFIVLRVLRGHFDHIEIKMILAIFPTGSFTGVYYSEELKYAQSLGYEVIPYRGYLFDKMESPFINFVSTPFENRSKAKQEGNQPLSYIYKILMNSLYGRFGINPETTVTEICSNEKYMKFLKESGFMHAYPIKEEDDDDDLEDHCWAVTFKTNTQPVPLSLIIGTHQGSQLFN